MQDAGEELQLKLYI